MTDSIFLPVRPQASKIKSQDSLQSRIIRIHSQKGAFRHITEASLIEEINSQKLRDEDANVAGEQKPETAETEEPQDRYQTIIKSRDEMMQQLRWVRRLIW